MTSYTDGMGLLFLAAALLASTGCALGDCDTETTSQAVCADALDRYEDINFHFYQMSVDCFAQNRGDSKQSKTPTNLDERKTQFRNVCGKRRRIRECLDAVERTSGACQNQAGHQTYRILRDLIETTLDTGCIQDGGVIASMLTTYQDSPDGPFISDPLRDCITTGVLDTIALATRHLTFSSFFYVLYKDGLIIQACLGDITNGDHQVESMLGEITNKIKCVDPRDGSAVLCKTIDVTSPDAPRLCPVGSVNEKETPLLTITMKNIKLCLWPSLIEFDSRLAAIKSLEMSRAYVEHHCSKRPTLGRCLADVLSLSSVCLNETEHNTVKISVQLIQGVHRYGCSENGRHSAHVLFNVLNDGRCPRKPKKKTAFQEFLDVVYEGGEGVGKKVDSRILDLYRHLNIFKGSLVGKLRGNNKAVYYAYTLLTLFQRNMRCLDPRDGSVVPCETVDTTTPTIPGECPYVGEHEKFVDQAFACLSVNGVDLDVVEALTTVEESRPYFRAACQRRTDVAHCLDGVTALSESCQNHTGHQTMLMFADLLRDATRIGCEGEGEVFANLALRFGFTRLRACLEKASVQIKNSSSSDDSAQAKSLVVYRAFESVRRCFFVSDICFVNTAFTLFINEILRSLKCVHPDGTLVLCQTIVNNRFLE